MKVPRDIQRQVALVIAVLLFGCSRVFAHEGKPDSWDELWRAWAFEPPIVIPILISGWLYLRGLRRLWRASGGKRGIRPWEAFCFAGGWLALIVALVSPLHPWGSVLFSAHMTQHEILMLVAAPLLVLGRPLVAFLKALPGPWAHQTVAWARKGFLPVIWHAITYPFVAWLIHAAALWVWHAPFLFQATLEHEFVHALQHCSFLFSALLFWWAVIEGRRRAMGYGVAVLYMFTTALHSGLLGVLITVAQSIIYPGYAQTTQPWGLTPLEDQQLGGLIMWVPAGLVYIIAGLALFAGWLRASETRAQSRSARVAAGLIERESPLVVRAETE